MDAHAHAEDADHLDHAHGHHDDPEHIRKEIRTYLLVFLGLAILTGVTVWLAYGLQLPIHLAIAIALLVASVKGFLVAGFFMHLLNERKVVYGVLALTVFFFAVLMWGPWHHYYDATGNPTGPPPGAATQTSETSHGSGH
ncbi:MAG TPA: cytochrome C oxidase subunit IV family protein [Thermoanaerobaculia bacterium]|nr:cytochrome C oxidase subunit IV family protein [Thermoanaerobaculia bacterium]